MTTTYAAYSFWKYSILLPEGPTDSLIVSAITDGFAGPKKCLQRMNFGFLESKRFLSSSSKHAKCRTRSLPLRWTKLTSLFLLSGWILPPTAKNNLPSPDAKDCPWQNELHFLKLYIRFLPQYLEGFHWEARYTLFQDCLLSLDGPDCQYMSMQNSGSVSNELEKFGIVRAYLPCQNRRLKPLI